MIQPITIALVGCGKAKLDRPAAARDLYTGSLFVAARRWAEECDEWRILSARYSVLEPDAVIAPYDTRLPRNRAERAQWGQSAANRIVGDFLHAGPYELVVLAGEDYAEPLLRGMRTRPGEDGWRCNCVGVRTPLAGLGLGARMAWFARERAGMAA